MRRQFRPRQVKHLQATVEAMDSYGLRETIWVTNTETAPLRDVVLRVFAKWGLDAQKELIAGGAYLEYVAVSCVSPIFYEQNPTELASWIEELGGDRLIFSSDLGQASAAPHPEGMRMLLTSLLDVGTSYDELEKMTKANPAQLLGLSA